jgi:hypothetical protein
MCLAPEYDKLGNWNFYSYSNWNVAAWMAALWKTHNIIAAICQIFLHCLYSSSRMGWLSFIWTVSSSFKHVNGDVTWSSVDQNLRNAVHIQYNISYIVKYLELQWWKENPLWLNYTTTGETLQAMVNKGFTCPWFCFI